MMGTTCCYFKELQNLPTHCIYVAPCNLQNKDYYSPKPS